MAEPEFQLKCGHPGCKRLSGQAFCEWHRDDSTTRALDYSNPNSSDWWDNYLWEYLRPACSWKIVSRVIIVGLAVGIALIVWILIFPGQARPRGDDSNTSRWKVGQPVRQIESVQPPPLKFPEGADLTFPIIRLSQTWIFRRMRQAVKR